MGRGGGLVGGEREMVKVGDESETRSSYVAEQIPASPDTSIYQIHRNRHFGNSSSG